MALLPDGLAVYVTTKTFMFAAPKILSWKKFPGNFRRTALSVLFVALGTLQVFAQRPLGLDVSSFQGGNINWTNVGGAGYSFAWAKATEGVTVSDADFTINAINAKKAGMHLGAYDFAHPENNSPGAEANAFWSAAGAYIRSDGLSIQPALDYETFTAPNNIPVGATSYGDWANQWCSNIVSKAAAAGVSVKPVIYTSTCDAGYLNSSDAVWPPWIANPSGLSPQTGNPWNSSTTPCSSSSYEIWGSGAWTVWQYNWTATVPGISGTSNVDLDVFNGTSNQMIMALVVTNNGLPYIAVQPLWRAVDAGGSVTLVPTALGNAPLAYQWTVSGTKISGATNATYTLTNAQTGNSGNYVVIVTNVVGSATSSPAWLLVYPVQTTVFADNFDANTSGNWTVNKSSSDNTATFSFDYSTLWIPSAPNSTNGSTRGLQLKANLANGMVAALSLSPNNQKFAGDYRLHFDAWINVNGPFPAGGAGGTEFLTGGIGTAGNHTEWTGSGSVADGYYFSVDGEGGVSASSTTTGDYCLYSNTTLYATGSGAYIAGTDTTAHDNANIYYTTAFPTGQAAPALQQANYPQQSGSLSPGTLGLAWHDVIVSRRGSTVDWVVDGVRLATVSNASFTASNVCVGFWDPFASLSSSNAINFGLVDNVRVEEPAIPPAFTNQPFAQTVRLGTNVTFTAGATGLPSPNYQWLFNGANISGATNASYLLATAVVTNGGNYSVLATNVAGSVTSTNALLGFVPPSAAQFESISVGGGMVQIGFIGDAYWTYTLETSTNLTGWTGLTNLTSTNGIFNYTDTPDPNNPQQFYRARVGP